MGPAAISGAVHCLDALWTGVTIGPPVGIKACEADLRYALAFWHPAEIVADTSQDSTLGRLLTRLLGRPAIRQGQLLAWRQHP